MAPEFRLSAKPRDVSFAGYGAQLNNNVFSQQTIFTGVAKASFDDLKGKVLALEPQFVRIFYNDNHAGFPPVARPKTPVNAPQSREQLDRWNSFVDVVKLAQKANALINVTWQSGPCKTTDDRKTSMERFANVLEHLVKREGITQLRWATIMNEPNTVPDDPENPNIKPESLGQMYRLLDGFLKQRGVRRQVKLMGGDVIEGPKDTHVDRIHQTNPFNQFAWLKFMGKHLSDVLDAYAVHIYWDYFALPKMKLRLDGVKKVADFVNRDLPPGKRKRVYITEFGVRGRHVNKDKGVDPGFFHEGGTRKRLCDTNIAAFQHALFMIRAAKGGYAGIVKWDCYYGRYDLLHLHPPPGKPKGPPKGDQQYFAIDKPATAQGTEWHLLPMYFLLRLFTATTGRDWHVRPVDITTGNKQPSKQLVAFQSSAGELTIFGLHIGGAGKNARTNPDIHYTIGGLPKNTAFQLLFWNQRGGGGLRLQDGAITTGAGGIAEVTAPMLSVFALTTKRLSAPLA